jgi:glutamate synthase (NADPH/NADH) small chain
MEGSGHESATGSPHNSRHGWQEIARVDLPRRAAADRVADFLEIYTNLDPAAARAQAERCVQCPNPACVTGCPMANRIPEWLALTAEGHFLEAAELVVLGNSMPEVFPRLCAVDRQCEAQCILDGPSEPVAIGAIERFLQDYALRHGLAAALPQPPNGFRVAVVGAGPGGLVCTEDLLRLGYAVTVFDARAHPGGLLAEEVPAFRLARAVVDRRIELMRERGVRFRLGVQVCVDVTLAQLREEFDAVVLAVGARQARMLALPGADLAGVYQGAAFLVQHGDAGAGAAAGIGAKDRQVVVLGGGDTAMDCLRTAIRCAARSTLCVYRRDEASMPATRRLYRNAVEEGARFQFQAVPVAILGDGSGRVTGVRCRRTAFDGRDAEGRRRPVAVAGSDFEVAADLVLVAYGFERVAPPAGGDLAQLARTAAGDLLLDGRGMTSMPGVFAGGDLIHGPGRLVDTVRDGRRAAAAIHAYLSAGCRRLDRAARV